MVELVPLAREHWELMETLQRGIVWEWNVDQAKDDILHYLIDNGLATAREDKQHDWFELTESGSAALYGARQQYAEQAEQEAKEECAEAKRLQERHEDRADEERRYHGNNLIAIIAALLSFAGGILTEHFFGIVAFLHRLFGGS